MHLPSVYIVAPPPKPPAPAVAHHEHQPPWPVGPARQIDWRQCTVLAISVPCLVCCQRDAFVTWDRGAVLIAGNIGRQRPEQQTSHPATAAGAAGDSKVIVCLLPCCWSKHSKGSCSHKQIRVGQAVPATPRSASGSTDLGVQLHKFVAQQAVHALHSAGVGPERVVHARKVDVCRGERGRQGRG